MHSAFGMVGLGALNPIKIGSKLMTNPEELKHFKISLLFFHGFF